MKKVSVTNEQKIQPIASDKLVLLSGIRFVGLIFVFWQHFLLAINCQLSYFSIFSVLIGSIGVAFFTFASGAGLYLSAQRKQYLKLKEFYSGRFFRLMIPFYCAYIVALIINWIYDPNLQLYTNVSSLKVWSARVLLELSGGSGKFFQLTGERNFFQVGEWYLGVIIVLTLLFPLLYQLVKRFPIWTILIATAFFLLQFVYLKQLFPTLSIVFDATYITQLLIFICGMTFAKYYNWFQHQFGEFRKSHYLKLVVAICILATCSWVMNLITTDRQNAIVYNCKILITSTSVAIVIYILSSIYTHWRRTLPKIAEVVNKFSFEAFLIHHVIILRVCTVYSVAPNSPLRIGGMLIMSIALTAFFTLVIKGFSLRVTNLLTNSLANFKLFR